MNILNKEDIQWLKDNGYIDKDGRVDFSDAFIAILSHTTRQGNSLKAPLQAIRKYGLIPKQMLPQVPMFDDYHNPKRITQKMLDLGQEFNERYKINYYKDYTYTGNEMLDTAGFAWGNIVNGVYQRVEYPFNHAFAIMTESFEVFDNYLDRGVSGDFIKQLAQDYRLLPYSYRITIKKKDKLTLLDYLKSLWLKRNW